MKKKEILPFTTVWTKLECIMLSKMSQRKTNTVQYHLSVESPKTKFTETELDGVYCVCVREREREKVIKGYNLVVISSSSW